ncbi:MAG: helix-turn-helix domain-containing protein [Beijerinckiaceae bacterium]
MIDATQGNGEWSCTKLACSPEEAAYKAGVGRTTIFAEMKAGRLPRRKAGRRTIILIDDLVHWLKSLPNENRIGSDDEGVG